MAPISASVTGFPPQEIDTERLRKLKESLCAVKEESEDLLTRLAECVEPWTKWLVEEQVSLSYAADKAGFSFDYANSRENNRWTSTTGYIRSI